MLQRHLPGCSDEEEARLAPHMGLLLTAQADVRAQVPGSWLQERPVRASRPWCGHGLPPEQGLSLAPARGRRSAAGPAAVCLPGFVGSVTQRASWAAGHHAAWRCFWAELWRGTSRELRSVPGALQELRPYLVWKLLCLEETRRE